MIDDIHAQPDPRVPLQPTRADLDAWVRDNADWLPLSFPMAAPSSGWVPYRGMEGEPLSMAESMFYFAHPETRRVAWTELEDGWVVSTVLLVLDHSHGFGPPLIFETLVFDGGGGVIGDLSARYSTRANAEAGHAETVAELTAEVPPPHGWR